MMMILALSLSYRSGSHPSSAALVIVLNMAFLSLIAPKHLKSAYDLIPLRTPLAIVLNLAFLSLIAPKHLRSAYDAFVMCSLSNIIPTRTKIRVLRRSLLRLIMKGNPGFDAGNAGDQGGYTYFTSGPGQYGFNFRPNEWQNMGWGHGSSKSLSFSFGGPGGHSSFGFGLEDIFSNFFGGGGGQSESFSGLTRLEAKIVKPSRPFVRIWVYILAEHPGCLFIHTDVRDVSDPAVRRLGVDALPAVVGWLSNGEKHTLKTRISVKDIKSAVEDLSALLDGLEKRNKKAASSQAKKPHSEAGDKQIPLLLPFNFDAVCGDTTPVCIIGAFRSSKARGKLETILTS
ncbi:unnamed protein product [Camellia sinensis]